MARSPVLVTRWPRSWGWIDHCVAIVLLLRFPVCTDAWASGLTCLCQIRADSYRESEMSGLWYFALQIQSWFFKTQSKKIFKCKSKSKKFEKCSLFTTKMPHFFAISSVQIRSGPKFWSDLQSGSNPNITQFAIVRIQSNAYLCHECSSAIERHHNCMSSVRHLSVLTSVLDCSRSCVQCCHGNVHCAVLLCWFFAFSIFKILKQKTYLFSLAWPW